MKTTISLILDEPTNHLDIDGVKEILKMPSLTLMERFFCQPDRCFINRVATKVMEISEDGATIYLETMITTLRRRRSLKS